MLGQDWINHWGAHGKQSTRGMFAPGAAGHPILRGIADGEIWGPTDVYEATVPLPDGCQPLVLGQVLQGMQPSAPPVLTSSRAGPSCAAREEPMAQGRPSSFLTLPAASAATVVVTCPRR